MYKFNPNAAELLALVFIHSKLELLPQFRASNDEKYILYLRPYNRILNYWNTYMSCNRRQWFQ